MLRSLIHNRALVWQLARRELLGRYRGSWLGLLWALLTPLATLLMYGFVFGVVLGVRWPVAGSDGAFVGPMLAGMTVFMLVAECITRAPGLIVSHADLIKKIAFPTEVLGAAMVIVASVQALVSLGLLLLWQLATGHGVGWASLWLVPVWLMLAALALGATYLLAAIGVFVRDLAQVVGLATSALLLLSPIMYPLSAVPAVARSVVAASPLTPFIEATRAALIHDTMPPAASLGAALAFSALSLALGTYVFRRARRAFADVL